jgi:hypothetical protein
MCAVVDELRGRETDREERLRDELERQLAKEKKGTEKSEA